MAAIGRFTQIWRFERGPFPYKPGEPPAEGDGYTRLAAKSE